MVTFDIETAVRDRHINSILRSNPVVIVRLHLKIDSDRHTQQLLAP